MMKGSRAQHEGGERGGRRGGGGKARLRVTQTEQNGEAGGAGGDGTQRLNRRQREEDRLTHLAEPTYQGEAAEGVHLRDCCKGRWHC